MVKIGPKKKLYQNAYYTGSKSKQGRFFISPLVRALQIFLTKEILTSSGMRGTYQTYPILRLSNWTNPNERLH